MLRKLLFCLFLTHYEIAFATTQTDKKVCDSNCTPQTSQSDKRGSKDSPLVVDTRTNNSKEEADEETRKDTEQKRVNRWNIGLTFAIAICALLQFGGIIAQVVVYLKQTKIMRDTLTAISGQATTMETQVKDARESAVAAALTTEATLGAFKRQADAMEGQNRANRDRERGRLSIQVADFELGKFPVVNYKLTCHGTSPAFVKSSWELTSLLPIPDFEWSKEAYGTALSGLPEVVSNGTTENYTFIMGTDREHSTPDSLKRAIEKGDLYLHFRVRIAYEDIFEEKHDLLVSKVYGLPPKNPYSGLYGLETRYPEWRDSACKYGQDG
jgi:hypothetical protein